MANASKMGLPAFISELRTARATITVHSTGEKPSTTRNGMLAPCTSTIDPIRPNRRATAGWTRIASAVPRLVMAKIGVHRGQAQAELVLDEDVQERDQLAGAQRGEEAGQQQPEEEPPIQDDDAEIGARPWPVGSVGRRSVAGQQPDGPKRERHRARRLRSAGSGTAPRADRFRSEAICRALATAPPTQGGHDARSGSPIADQIAKYSLR